MRAKQAKVQRTAEEPVLLKLQRSSGTMAVAEMVQRDHAASTDAPGAKKREHKALGPFHGRVIKNDIVDGKTYITIGGGAKQGIQPGMKGWLENDGGRRLVSFEIEKVNDRSSGAFVEATLDEIKEYMKIEIDRDSMPAVEDQGD